MPDLETTLAQQYAALCQRLMGVVESQQAMQSRLLDLMGQTDALQQAMTEGWKRSRNRTFGSNW